MSEEFWERQKRKRREEARDIMEELKMEERRLDALEMKEEMDKSRNSVEYQERKGEE